ncbi:MAG TPA: PQQ-binding-like beta-propeller repeat protein [Verrucomicrobiae bacterium]
MKFRPDLCLLVLALPCALPAADWPQWRGPNRDGVSPETISTNWGVDGPKVLWRASVGTGFSSVSVSNGRAYTLGNTNNEDTAWCFDAKTGKQIWKFTYASRLDPQWYEGGPGSTPTVDGDRVYTISKWGDVCCLDARKGKVIWRRDLRQDGLKPNRWGFEGSPLIWRDLVILNAGAAGTALDRNTGRPAWCNGTNAAGYASPTLFVQNGKETILVFAAKHLVALDPRTGHELWRQFWETGWDTNITDPLLWGNRILISSFTRGCALLSLNDGKPEVIYDKKVLHNHLSPGILIGDYLYAFNGEAKTDTDFRCLHLPSGDVKWTRKDPIFGSLIKAGDCLLILSAKGELIAAEPSPEGLKVVARAQVLSSTCWTPPALAGGLLYIRNAKGELRCLDLRPSKG